MLSNVLLSIPPGPKDFHAKELLSMPLDGMMMPWWPMKMVRRGKTNTPLALSLPFPAFITMGVSGGKMMRTMTKTQSICLLHPLFQACSPSYVCLPPYPLYSYHHHHYHLHFTGLKIGPNDAALKNGVEDVRKAQASSHRPAAGGGGGNPLSALFGSEALLKMASHPKYSKLLSDPVFMSKFQMMQSNPSAMAQMFQDPEMMEVLSFIMGIDMKQPGGAGDGGGGGDDPFPPSPPPKEAKKATVPEEPVEEDLNEEEKAQRKRKLEALDVSHSAAVVGGMVVLVVVV